ncbi:hypothetical protein GCM10010433_19830 [Streptomyces pulveraceus]
MTTRTLYRAVPDGPRGGFGRGDRAAGSPRVTRPWGHAAGAVTRPGSRVENPLAGPVPYG